MTDEAKAIVAIYEASSDQGRDLIMRAVWVYCYGTEEAKTLLDEVKNGGLTMPQVIARIEVAEQLSGKDKK